MSYYIRLACALADSDDGYSKTLIYLDLFINRRNHGVYDAAKYRVYDRKRSVLGGSVRIVLHFFVIEL